MDKDKNTSQEKIKREIDRQARGLALLGYCFEFEIKEDKLIIKRIRIAKEMPPLDKIRLVFDESIVDVSDTDTYANIRETIYNILEQNKEVELQVNSEKWLELLWDKETTKRNISPTQNYVSGYNENTIGAAMCFKMSRGDRLTYGKKSTERFNNLVQSEGIYTFTKIIATDKNLYKKLSKEYCLCCDVEYEKDGYVETKPYRTQAVFYFVLAVASTLMSLGKDTYCSWDGESTRYANEKITTEKTIHFTRFWIEVKKRMEHLGIDLYDCLVNKQGQGRTLWDVIMTELDIRLYSSMKTVVSDANQIGGLMAYWQSKAYLDYTNAKKKKKYGKYPIANVISGTGKLDLEEVGLRLKNISAEARAIVDFADELLQDEEVYRAFKEYEMKIMYAGAKRYFGGVNEDTVVGMGDYPKYAQLMRVIEEVLEKMSTEKVDYRKYMGLVVDSLVVRLYKLKHYPERENIHKQGEAVLLPLFVLIVKQLGEISYHLVEHIEDLNEQGTINGIMYSENLVIDHDEVSQIVKDMVKVIKNELPITISIKNEEDILTELGFKVSSTGEKQSYELLQQDMLGVLTHWYMQLRAFYMEWFQGNR